MIYITGDIHGSIERFFGFEGYFPEQNEMTKDDYIIILGDFGLIWNYLGENYEEKRKLDWLEHRPFTTLFVDGNHENFDRLEKYPVSEFHGGRVHELSPSVKHLMRGEIFTLQGKKFFTFGGASSHDIQDGVLDIKKDAEKIEEWAKDWTKMFRINQVSWWKQELPNEEEMENGRKNLEKHDWKVDYILTHSPSASTIALLGSGLYQQDTLTHYLEEIKQKAEYQKWFFGHMHINKMISTKELGIYEQIIRII